MARQFGKYEILETLGQGGMGTVYKARHMSSGRIVALKMLMGGAAASEESRQRFVREARAMARLRHRNIVAVHEVGEVDGVPFLAMEFIEGKTLSQVIKEGVPDERQAATWLLKIADAVEHAHQRRIVHRDLKPGNVIIDRHGEPVVMDFGLAKDVIADPGITSPDEVVGTPSYMSPEQVQGKALDARSDVFALGGVLYTLLTCRPPFEGPVRAAVMFQVTHREPEVPSRINLTISRDIETICLKAMQKAPEDRYPSADALAEDLRGYLLERGIKAKRDSGIVRAIRVVRRKKSTVAIGACCAIAVAALLTITLRGPSRSQDAAAASPPPSQPADEFAETKPLLTPATQPARTVTDGDRLLAQCRFEEAAASYARAGAEAARRDLARRVIDLRGKAAAALTAGGGVPATLRDGTRVTLSAIDLSGARTADPAGTVTAHQWESIAREDVYGIYRACLSSPTAQDRLGLGALCLALGLDAEAQREFDEAVRADPNLKAESDRFRTLQLAP